MSSVPTHSRLISAHLAAIVQSSGDAIITKDLNGIITSWNQGAEAVFGYTAAEVIGQPVTILMPDERVVEEAGILERIRKGEKVAHFETVRRHKDGRLIDISLNISPLIDDSGQIVGASKIARDISERKQTEAALGKLAAIVESSNDAIISKDLSGIITSWNKGAEKVFGYTAAEAIGQPVIMLIPADLLDEEPGIIERIRNGETVDHYETVRRRKDGALLDISLTVSPVFDAQGNIMAASKIARDITDKKRAEEALRKAELMQTLVAAQEAERHRIARDLHDHLGQQLTALRLKIEVLSEKGSAVGRELDGIREIASQIDRDVSFLSWELRPKELGDAGLEAALGSFVNEWSAQYCIPAEFTCRLDETECGPFRLSPVAETNIYRITQEAMNNILKHAWANQVRVLINCRGDHLVMVIEDDGEGFDLSQAADPKTPGGFGLVGMRERSALLGGTLEIESEAGKGTTLIVRIPLVANAPPASP